MRASGVAVIVARASSRVSGRDTGAVCLLDDVEVAAVRGMIRSLF